MTPSITGIVADPRRVKAAVIEVDGKRVGSLTQRGIERLGLAVGQAWDEELARQVAGDVEYEKYLHQADRWLDRRMLSAAEVAGKLAGAGCAAGLAGRVVERLTELGLIDDRKLGQLLIEGQTGKQPAGAALLRAKLQRRGLAEGLVEELVAGAVGTAAEAVEQALELARRKLAAMRGLDEITRKRRLAGLLARRGFDEQVIEEVVARVLGLDEK